ncbi:hypothetical protein PHYBLDRAFT_174983 [Phycomyces blakesleeanus NRRL 1555(-)]|uniref:Uncharacterized protein n=1 Tax=Phycomyces blakesleeanus (strain ATCC 8743b / DSM 1359 / FGSC 10004 / NBRC 33097 / NRRL 1555) TaxID=763407 RepID=A0A167JTQ9_PHYB8|nr:hypothetical protein PHYBLDRAFT_174983 [Phycomyces blakesleeanus NRRL 1555(-)]OAD66690.1 hypothetical protein PHYBLDRAFT_174983 [Phycomyces blakesleeanus NRRL 1555(-)]|eukprot:XP_018284730.1 hypothetical protein PHYBLDRAFT_174983 [Phycomyces blakesleeanus NRRL 1555(-)]
MVGSKCFLLRIKSRTNTLMRVRIRVWIWIKPRPLMMCALYHNNYKDQGEKCLQKEKREEYGKLTKIKNNFGTATFTINLVQNREIQMIQGALLQKLLYNATQAL